MSNRWTWSIVVAMVAACGSSDSTPSDGEKACNDLAAKAMSCGLMIAGTCNTSVPCAAECQAHADCSQLTVAPAGSLLMCLAACQGAGPDDFICKDGKAFVNKAALCDGKFQCLDGSDEADCGGADGGAG